MTPKYKINDFVEVSFGFSTRKFKGKVIDIEYMNRQYVYHIQSKDMSFFCPERCLIRKNLPIIERIKKYLTKRTKASKLLNKRII